MILTRFLLINHSVILQQPDLQAERLTHKTHATLELSKTLMNINQHFTLSLPVNDGPLLSDFSFQALANNTPLISHSDITLG